MVLSNKKQKQKRRAAKAELLAASEAQNHSIASDSGNPDSNSLSQHSVKSLLDTSSQKPRLSKREKRRERALEETVGRNQDGYAKRENKGDASSEKKDENEKKKKKKRKRDDGLESGVSQSVEVKKATKSKKKKNKVKNKKAKKVADVKVNNVVESTSGGSGENVVPEPSNLSDSHNNVHDTRKVYVGGIPYYSTEDDIRSYFENCGSMTEVDCMKFPESGKFRGIAIISFKTEAAAKRALALDGADMGGLFLKIQPYKSTRANKVPEFSPAIVEGYNRIYAGNLPWDITEEELRKLFSDCNINSVRFGEDKETGEFRGYAHVDFADSLSLNMALKLDQKIVCGRPVKISCAVPKKGADTKSKSVQTNKQVDNPGTNSVSGKIRRRTCYECGEKGHLSSSCPKKQVADLVTSKSVQTNMQVDDPGTNSVSGKIRRRTCYECGEKGHLGSSCPKKQGADLATADNTGMNSADVVTADNSGMNSADLVMTGNSGMNPISGKIRRRTCYECGEKGHLASSCTKKQAANLVTSGAT